MGVAMRCLGYSMKALLDSTCSFFVYVYTKSTHTGLSGCRYRIAQSTGLYGEIIALGR